MSRNRRVLVTGASGLVGSGVLHELRLAGYDMIGLSRQPRPPHCEGTPWIRQDLAQDLEATLNRHLPFAAVIHLAATINPTGERPLRVLRSVNMEASERLFEYCGRNQVATVIYVSSLGMMPQSLGRPIRESDTPNPVLPYHVSKYWAELALREAAAQYEFNGVILRISSPITTGFALLPPNVLRTWLTRARTGQPIPVWGWGTRTQDFVAVDDIGRAVLQVLETRPSSNLLHIASGQQTSMRQLADAISEISGVPVISANAVDTKESERWDFDISHARAAIGYIPRYQITDYLPLLWEESRCAAA